MNGDANALTEEQLIVLVVVLFVICFSLLWIGITSLLGMLSGWKRMERTFPDRPEQPIERFAYESARMRGVNFKNCLAFEVCPTGLRISLMRILGPFRKPLFVPWSQIRAVREKLAFFNYVRLTLGMGQEGSLAIHAQAFERIAQTSPVPLRLD